MLTHSRQTATHGVKPCSQLHPTLRRNTWTCAQRRKSLKNKKYFFDGYVITCVSSRWENVSFRWENIYSPETPCYQSDCLLDPKSLDLSKICYEHTHRIYKCLLFLYFSNIFSLMRGYKPKRERFSSATFWGKSSCKRDWDRVVCVIYVFLGLSRHE